jgi:hypothetical protein
VDATLLLANSAEATPSGTVSALGLGWSVTVTPTPPTAVIILLLVPWDQANIKHDLYLRLTDSDGNVVLIPQPPTGDMGPLEVSGEFEVGRPPGLPHGTDIDHPMPLNISAGLTLTPGQRYQWRLDIDGETVATRGFLVRS